MELSKHSESQFHVFDKKDIFSGFVVRLGQTYSMLLLFLYLLHKYDKKHR